MPRGMSAVDDAVERLAGCAPEGAIALLSQADTRGVIGGLLPKMAVGIGNSFSERAQSALLSAEPEVLGRLIAGGRTLAGRVAEADPLVARLGMTFPNLDPSLLAKLAVVLLPHLVANWQLPAAEPLIMLLDGPGLAAEVRHLGEANDFEASRMAEIAIQRARGIGAKDALRSALADLPGSSRRDAMLMLTLDASVDDATWLLHDPRLTASVASNLLIQLLRKADDRQLAIVVCDTRIGGRCSTHSRCRSARPCPAGHLRR